jgi:two-component system, OmpR family, phosphate regulon sensor histidine kinase PhoR
MRLFRVVRWQVAGAFALTLLAAGVAGTAVGTHARWDVIAMVVAAGFISAGLLIRALVQVGSSVRAVAEGADSMAAGELTQRVYAPANAETRHLAAAFNRMADALQTTVEGLSLERARLSALVETMADGVVLVNASGAIDLSNHAARALLVLNPDGGFLRDPDLLALARQAREDKERVQKGVELLPGPRFVSAIATPLEDDQVLLTVHDLTAVRNLNVTRREFVSNVSHELRNPLAAMGVLVETLQNGAAANPAMDPAMAADFTGRLAQEIVRMNALVADLLTLSRLESGAEDGDVLHMDMAEALDAAKTAAIQKRGPEAAVEIEAAPGVLAAVEPLRFRQVVDNLLENALRFTPVDGSVRMSAVRDAEWVRFTIKDTGEGIDAEHLPHIFERFYKADPSRHDPGTGLGLSIVRHIVETRGGSVAVESSPGGGTTFTVLLPAIT